MQILSPFEIISSIYFDKLIDELETVLDELGAELYGHVDTRMSMRKQNDLAMADQLKDKLTKSSSKVAIAKIPENQVLIRFSTTSKQTIRVLQTAIFYGEMMSGILLF